MPWFGPKKYKIVISDKELGTRVQWQGTSVFLEFYKENRDKVGAKNFNEFYSTLIREGKLNSSFIDNYWSLSELQRDNLGLLLYRGINPKEYKLFLKYGNTKNDINISATERFRLSQLGLNPQEVMYAWVGEYKAWEFARKFNPSIIVIYDITFFEKIDTETFLYRIKRGFSFKDAVKAYVLIWYK